MGKITLLVKTCLIILLNFVCSNSLLAFENSELVNISSSSESICYMFFESKEVEPIAFKDSLLKTFNASNYKNSDAKSSSAFAQPTITFASPAIPDICKGTTTAVLSYTATTQNPSKYTILFSSDAKAQGFSDDVKNHTFPNGSGSISIAVPANAPPGTYNATFFVSNADKGNDRAISITIKDIPTVNKPSDQKICNNNSTTSINFSGNNLSGVVYNWTNSNSAIGLATSGTGNISAFNAKNITNSPISANIVVTPTANGCVGSSQNFTITVNPTTTLTKPTDVVACNNENISAINFIGSNVSGTTYNWTNDNINIGLAASGNTNIASFVAKNSTNDPIVANITVIPSANGCVGTPQTFKITVNPTATFTRPADITACNNSTISAITFAGNNVSGTTYSWTNDNTSIGLGSSGNGNISAFTAKNSTNASIVANLTVTPTANGCIGTPQTFKITVYSTANFTKPLDVVACNTDQISAITFGGSTVTGSATSYSWVNDNANIGLPASGTGNIASFTAVNSTSAPITGNITVIPTANGCAGNPKSFKITVNPTTSFTKPSDIIACNSEIISAINFTGNTVTGTTYTWTNSNPSIGIGASGTGNISTFNGINTSNAPVTAVIIVTPRANNCDGISQQFEITVNPTPSVTKPTNLIFCNSDISSEIVFEGSQVNNTTYTWTNNNTAIGLAASGTGNLPSFTAVNNGTSQILAEITVIPIANNCAGAPQIFTIKVNPSIVINLELTPVSCNGEKNGAININSATGGNGTLSFSLDNTNFDTNTTLGNLYAGIYTLTVKDSEVCTYQIEVEIEEPEELSVTDATSTAETCYSGINGIHDGTITAGTISGGNEEYEYSIDNTTFQSSPSFTGLAAGNYTVFIKDNKGCATQSNITVGSLSEMKATLTKTDIKCFGDNSGLVNVNNATGGSGTYEYQIINNNDITGSEDWISTPTFTGLITGNYTINIRDVTYPTCIVTINNSYTLTQPAATLTSPATATRTLNYGSPTGSATAIPSGGSGGYTYEWRVSGQINVIQTTKTANSLAAGIYELTVYDSNGCSVIQTVTVTDIVKVEISETSRCLQNTDNIRTSSFQVDPDLTVGGIGDPYNFTYKWDFGASAAPSTAQGLDRFEVKYNSKGDKIITLTVTDEAGIVSVQKFDHYVGGCFEGCIGTNQSQEFQIDKNNYFIGDKFGIPLTEGNCATTTEKYLWIDITKSSNAYVLDVELIYSTTKEVFNITGVPITSTDSGQLTGCFGKKIINGNNGKYEWELIPVGLFPLFQVNSAESNVNIEWECEEGFSIDQIRIRWTTNSGKECGDATGNSCIDSKEIVPVSVPLYANAEIKDTPCFGTALGSLVISAYGGVKPYLYSITGDVTENYVTTKEFYNLTVGSYTEVYVRDSKGTTYYFDPASKPIVVNQPDALSLSVLEDASIVCFGDLTSATANATGGTAPYTYLWNDNASQVTKTAAELKAGTYTVTVTDANDCQSISTIIIEEPLELTVPLAGEDQSFKCGVVNTFLEGNTPEQGVGKWIIKSGTGGELSDKTDPSSPFSGIANAIYTLEWTISNADGTCIKFDEMTISFSDDCSALDFDGVDDHVNFGDNHNFSTGNFTLETWVKLNSIDGVRTVISKRDASNLGSGGYDLIINNGAPTFRWGNISVSTSTKLTTSRWYHIAVSYNSDKYVLYVDGLDVGTKTGVRPSSIDSPFLLGAMYNKLTPEIPSNYFNGWIEELRIWNKSLSEDQLHFLMNQRLEIGVSPVKGTVLPMVVPDNLLWSDLKAYYQLLSADVGGGITLDETSNQINGILKNIETNQDNSAPLPYISESGTNGNWKDKNTWDKNAGADEDKFWSWPNDNGINGQAINWNIAITKSDSINSGGHDITVLGLIIESGKLKMLNPNDVEDETNSGQGLLISQYLKLNGEIKLFGDSQLVQSEGSIIDEVSTGIIEKDQQGTASSFNYNYWSSPVVPVENDLNSTYTVASIMMDGTNSKNPKDLDFGQGVTYADGAASSNGDSRKISNYWIYKFRGKADEYSDYQHIGSTGILNVGEGYTMKGTSGNAAISDRQNYIFKGKPNNGDISLTVGKDQNYLLGNPYPSALDANKFILDNLNASGGTNSKNIFNGALYFWDHFGGGSHQLAEYVGGYATYNLIGGVKAIVTDYRINVDSEETTSDDNVPGQFIPVGQGFFINTVLDNDLSGNITIEGGDVLFKNSQRAFVREQNYVSRFLSQEKASNTQKEAAPDPKIRLDFSSPLGYHRQILVGANANATNGFDLGYDAPLNDYNEEDFFWLINNYEYVIQGVGNFDPEQILPIGIYISKKGEFKIKINKLENVPEETTIYLKDIEKNEYFDLRASEFKMEIEPGAYYERFQIVFNKPEEENSNPDTSNDDTTDDEDTSSDDSSEETNEETEDGGTGGIETPEVISNSAIDIRFMSDNRELAIFNPSLMPIQKVEIYNLLGQRVQKYIEITNEKEIRLPVYEYASGIYVVRLFSENSRVSKNIIMKK